MLTYEKYARAWEKAVNDQDTDELVSLQTDDFRWMTFTQKPGGLDQAGTRAFCLGGQINGFYYTSTIHESDEIIAGWHDITRQDEASRALSVVKVRDGKVHEFHHSRAPKLDKFQKATSTDASFNRAAVSGAGFPPWAKRSVMLFLSR